MTISHLECDHEDSILARTKCRRKRRGLNDDGAIDDSPRVCTKCKQEKPAYEFAKARNTERGRRSQCKECERGRNKHGLSTRQRRDIYEAQRGKCKLCGDWRPRLFIDHCHRTGKVRGGLCPGCNLGVGWLENREWRKRAIAYLKGEL